ncbi:GDSL-type esterase/lipase family protein [Terrimonas sp. NA20]|uniref:GDSL-type esterase/lipase family protein n=1 Tax=Terrimonas ginsenosidimutans TaxID=2908004 RepID=A0ABS9KUX1_9BACT|nr:GDSL-type esterase/lipase family protein [Terrimonas ginsenosidimutans]MCG2616128.1 GDSL-type esterase/lipase family protein [Terrimonas ginsenosidimutans]
MKVKKTLNCFILLASLFFSATNLQAQPFAQEIREFKRQDSLHFPASNQILLIGSSSFTKWKDVQSYFPSYPILNRGFGGSQLPDQVRYVNEIVFPYKPKQIIIYCGENDMASHDSVTAQVVLRRFKELFTLIRSKLPNVPVAFISMKPSPSRQLIQPKVIEGNALIRAFLKKQKRTAFIDVYKEMINDEGKPVADLFVDDNLHMNAKGYAIWKKVMEPHLMKK